MPSAHKGLSRGVDSGRHCGWRLNKITGRNHGSSQERRVLNANQNPWRF